MPFFNVFIALATSMPDIVPLLSITSLSSRCALFSFSLFKGFALLLLRLLLLVDVNGFGAERLLGFMLRRRR